jgi:hypothetical protein
LVQAVGWHLAAADEQRVMLFDLRRCKEPVLQWDHMMEGCPPRLLTICPNHCPTRKGQFFFFFFFSGV